MLEALKAGAGEDYVTAVFYPKDDRYLVAYDEVSSHVELITHAPHPGD